MLDDFDQGSRVEAGEAAVMAGQRTMDEAKAGALAQLKLRQAKLELFMTHYTDKLMNILQRR